MSKKFRDAINDCTSLGEVCEVLAEGASSADWPRLSDSQEAMEWETCLARLENTGSSAHQSISHVDPAWETMPVDTSIGESVPRRSDLANQITTQLLELMVRTGHTELSCRITTNTTMSTQPRAAITLLEEKPLSRFQRLRAGPIPLVIASVMMVSSLVFGVIAYVQHASIGNLRETIQQVQPTPLSLEYKGNGVYHLLGNFTDTVGIEWLDESDPANLVGGYASFTYEDGIETDANPRAVGTNIPGVLSHVMFVQDRVRDGERYLVLEPDPSFCGRLTIFVGNRFLRIRVIGGNMRDGEGQDFGGQDAVEEELIQEGEDPNAHPTRQTQGDFPRAGREMIQEGEDPNAHPTRQTQGDFPGAGGELIQESDDPNAHLTSEQILALEERVWLLGTLCDHGSSIREAERKERLYERLIHGTE